MGNALAGWRRAAKVMTVDGSTFRYKTPAAAGDALRGHPGHQLLESEEVRRLGVRARPLDPDAPLKPGKLYFLVQIPRGAAGAGADEDPRAPRKTWSGALHVGARERLESLMLSRRTVSDVAFIVPCSAARLAASAASASSPRPFSKPPPPSSVEVGVDGAVRLRMRLPKAEVARLMKESKDPAEAAERIMQLCVARDQGVGVATTPPPPRPCPPVLPASALLSGRNPTPPGCLKKEVSIACMVKSSISIFLLHFPSFPSISYRNSIILLLRYLHPFQRFLNDDWYSSEDILVCCNNSSELQVKQNCARGLAG
jgi:hypothetical protein